MAETPLKRQREETQVIEDGEDSKRHKSYNHILSLLELEEEEPNQDLSSLITTLEHELSSSDSLSFPVSEIYHENPATASATSDCGSSSSLLLKEEGEEEDDDKERVIRHLLQASDDELGIPHREVRGGDDGEDVINSGDLFSLCDGLWEFEDEAANYYTLLQSELFM